MSIKIIIDRLKNYQAKTQLEETNALKEITQEIALSGLSRGGFFKVGVFNGGTALRIFHGLNRFSEDLDFSLNRPNSAFEWSHYFPSLQNEFAGYGYQLQIQDRGQIEKNVKSVFIKDQSLGKILILKNKNQGMTKALRIKLEIDTNPPDGGIIEQKYLDFPVTVPIIIHDLPSLFAGKCHALLCRPWEKGRDWYDFSWYVGRKVTPNFNFAANAIDQLGPWQGKKPEITQAWLLEKLNDKILSIDWEKNKEDIARFLKESDLDLLTNWNKNFFLNRLELMRGYLY